MNLQHLIVRVLFSSLILSSSSSLAGADDLRNVKRGEAMPNYKLPAIGGAIIDSAADKGSVVVITCLSAEQRRSELVATESMQVIRDMSSENVHLIHVTADAVQKPYFEKFRQDKSITAPLAFDTERTLYGKLGIIAFPTTIIVNKDGMLDSVILLHGSDYKLQLDAHIRHALGKLNDKDLEEKLAARPAEVASPRSAAAAHRSLARLMRERGEIDAARKELSKGLELDPSNQEIELDLADLEIATGNIDGADVMLQRVLQSQPEHRRAKQLKGIALFRRGNLDEALTVLQDSLALNPSPELAHYYLGRIYEQKGNKDQALAQYHLALKHFVHEIDVVKVPTPNPAK